MVRRRVAALTVITPSAAGVMAGRSVNLADYERICAPPSYPVHWTSPYAGETTRHPVACIGSSSPVPSGYVTFPQGKTPSLHTQLATWPDWSTPTASP